MSELPRTSRRGVIGMLAGLSAAGAGIITAQPAKAAPSISAADAEIYEMIRKEKEAERIAEEALHADLSAYEKESKRRLAAWKRKKWRESGLRASEHERPWTRQEELAARERFNEEIGYNSYIKSTIFRTHDEHIQAINALSDAPQADSVAAVAALAAAMFGARYNCSGKSETIVRQLKNLAGKEAA